MKHSLSTLNARLGEDLSTRIARGIAAKNAHVISRMELFLTERCTLRCDYCFVADKQASRRMTWPVARAAVDMLMRESRDREDVDITLIGGEPLLEFALIRRVVEYAEETAAQLGKRVTFPVTTNGTIMTQEIALFGQQHGINYLLSLDGDREAHDRHRKTPNGRDSWDIAMGANFDILRSVQPWIGARVTVSPDTVGVLSENIQLLHNRGVNQFIVGPNQDVPWNPEHLAAWETQAWDVAQFCAAEISSGRPIRVSFVDSAAENPRNRYAGMWGCWAGAQLLQYHAPGIFILVHDS